MTNLKISQAFDFQNNKLRKRKKYKIKKD